MKEKLRLYGNTVRLLGQWFDLSSALGEVMTWFVRSCPWTTSFGFIFATDSRLPRIAAQIPWSATLPSRTQRLWRWLKNPRITPLVLSQAIALWWLANFREKTIYLVIDRTDINNTHWLLFLA